MARKPHTWFLAALVAVAMSAVSAVPAAHAAPLPGSLYDSQDGNQVTNTNPAALDWQDIAPQDLLTTNLDDHQADTCFTGGQEETPNTWTFGTVAGGCTPGKSDLLGMWTHSELLQDTGVLHAAFIRRSAGGDSYITFELNQRNTTWTNSMGTTIPCRSNGDLLFSYNVSNSGASVTINRWVGDGSGPASCPNGARGTFQSSAAINSGLINSVAITNYLSPDAITAALGKSTGDRTVESGLFGEAQIDIKSVLDSMNIGSCYSFVAAQAHTRSSASIASALIDYLPQVAARVANCSVSGTAYSDANNNGVRDSGEGGAAGRTAYIDLNGNGSFDASEPSAMTDGQGYYVIPTSLNSGTYPVRIVVPSGVYCTSPAGCAYSRTFTNMGTNSVANDFGLYFPQPPQNTGPPIVSGTLQEGSTLTASTGTWTGHQPINYAYRWLRCDAAGTNCSEIAGATSGAYGLTPSDVAKTIRVRVTATNMVGSASTQSFQTAPVSARPPVNTVLPEISGTPEDGAVLTASTGTWTGTEPITYAYQWLRCDTSGGGCADIADASSQTYDVVAVDVGQTIRVRVTAMNAGGESSVQSAQTVTVAASALSNTVPPSISGATEEGSTLTASPGSWAGTEPIAYAYQWRRCDASGAACVDIGAATNQTYALVPADVGSTIRVRVTATNSADESSAQSAETAPVTARPPVNVAAPVISGPAEEGSSLTASEGTWTGTATIGFGYQWLRCDAAGANCSEIAGATSSTYDLVPADVDATIRVRVTGTNAGGGTAVESDETQTVSARSVVNTAPPAISGSAVHGATLTASPGAWAGTEPITYAYQWLLCDVAGANCAEIAGATAQDYVVALEDIDHTIRVRVDGSNVAGGPVAAQSDATAVVDPAAPVNTSEPTVGGTVRDGETLTADPGVWAGTGPFDHTYQWQRCDAQGENCVDIPGATNSIYTPGHDDVGSTVRVVVTATNDAGTQSTASDAVGPVAASLPSNNAAPSISGTPEDGQTLTADSGTWAGTPEISFGYQWLRCDADGCTPISGANSQSYDLTAADVGFEIAVAVTATNAAGSATEDSAAVGSVAADAPANTTSPSIGGTAEDGKTLTASPGEWSGTGPVDHTYQWQRCDAQGESCVDIPGATDSTYTPGPADVGSTVRVVVTATNEAGRESSASTPTAVVAAAPPSNAAAPSVTGTAADEQVLTAAPGTWDGTGPFDYTYQWQRCDVSSCQPIAGATSSTYTLTDDDVGFDIRVAVTAGNGAGSDTEVSAALGPVAATQPVNTTTPSLSGTAGDGEVLTAAPGEWSGTGPFEHSYQWQRCDVSGCTDIPGATGPQYELTDADVGFQVRVVVTATGPGGSNAETSEAVGPVLPQAPVNTVVPAIAGDARDGATLTSNSGTWTGTGPLDLTYQWLRCDGTVCVAIPGATGSSYDLTAADVGYEIVLRLTVTNAGGSTTHDSNRIGPVAAVPPAMTAPPTIDGDPRDGGTLTAAPGTWTGTGPIEHTYQWLRCHGNSCEEIPGATGQTYTPGPDDVGYEIRVDVTATGPGGSVTERSEPTGPIAAVAPENLTPPSFSGALEVGSELIGDPGTWSGTGPLDFGYQWLRCDAAGENCVEIPGSKRETYVLGPDDAGSTIRLVVTARNDAGSVEATTDAAGPVRVAAFDPDEDLSRLPGSLVDPRRCQQAPAPVAASVALRGVGRMRFRVAATGEQITPRMPLVATSAKMRTRRGSLRSLVKLVVYRLDRRRFRVSRRAPYRISIPPQRLAGSPRHTLTVTTIARSGERSTVNIRFRTGPCTALFTANHRAVPGRGGLRLRVDTRRSISRLAFRLPHNLIPHVRRRTSGGRLQLFLGGGNRPLYRLTFGTRSSRNGTLLSRAGAPRVRINDRRVSVTGLPSRVGIVKLQLVKRGPNVRTLRRRTPLWAEVITSDGRQLLLTRIGPKRRTR